MYRNPDNYRSDTPVYTLSRNVLNPEDFRYTSTIDTLDIGDSLIIVANLAMRPNPRPSYGLRTFHGTFHAVKNVPGTYLEQNVFFPFTIGWNSTWNVFFVWNESWNVPWFDENVP